MVWCNYATFVLQRRVNEDVEDVSSALTNRAIFDRGCVVSEHDRGALRLDGPFRVTDGFGHRRWRADATLLSVRGRTVAPVEVEVSPWSTANDTELTLRPETRRPDRWSSRKTGRYFELAHRAADDLTHLLHGAFVIPRAAPRPFGTAPRSSLPGACIHRR